MPDKDKIKERLEYLRGEIKAERISYGEIAELQDLAEHIEPDDMLLLEWAGVPEGSSSVKLTDKEKQDYLNEGGCCCPKCGSKDVDGDGLEMEGSSVYQNIRCNDCDFAWTDRYDLKGVTERA